MSSKPSRGGTLSDAQKWKVEVRGSGITLTNVATGKTVAHSGTTAKNKAAFVTRSFSGKGSEKFRPIRCSRLIEQGLYTFESVSASGKMLDVVGGSWNNNTNAQIYWANTTNAQKFVLIPASGGYYRILMVLSGNVLEVDSSKPRANVRLSTTSKNVAGQLWKPELTNNGLAFVNKANGSLLEVQGNKRASGTNVRVAPATGASNQSWKLTATTVNMTEVWNYRNIVSDAPTEDAPRLNTNGRNYSISQGAYDQLMQAYANAWSRGYYLDFFMMDASTGITLAYNADRNTYGASTSKAALVTYMFQELLENDRLNYGAHQTQMWNTIVWSNNETYAQLYGAFAGPGYSAWLNETGVGWVAYSQYTTTNPRSLEKVWARILGYERSGGRYVDTWRNMFDKSNYFFIREALSGENTVYSKPGWMFGGSYGTVHDDAAIVRDKSGRTYVLAVMTNLRPIEADRWIAYDVVRALDRIHQEMPRY